MACWDTGHTDAEQRRMLQQQRDFIEGKIHELTIALGRLDDILAVVSTHP